MFSCPTIALIIFLISVVPCLAKGPIQTFQIGNWQGGSYTDDNTGIFSHCAAYVSYPSSNITVIVTVERNYIWDISFGRPAWNFIIGELVPVSISFDSVGPFQLNAEAKTNYFITVTMPNSDVAIEAFKAANLMHLSIAGQIHHFNLLSSSILLPTLSKCVAQNSQASGIAAAATNPSSTIAPPTPKPNPEAKAAQDKLLEDAAKEYGDCVQKEMKELVPLSNEGADTLAQVITTKCDDKVQKYIEISMAIYGMSRAEVENNLRDTLEKQKKNIVAQIVTFRAELAKALILQQKEESQQKNQNTSDTKKGVGL